MAPGPPPDRPAGPSFEGDAAPPIVRPAPPGLRDRLAAAALGDSTAAGATSPGQGFSLFPNFDASSFNWSSYRLVLVASAEADVESFRDELQLAAARLAPVLQAPVTVAPGSIARPGGSGGSLRPQVGEIRVAVQSQSACGLLSSTATGIVGCGGPEVFDAPPGEPDLFFGGNVWLAPGLAPSGADGIRQIVVEHELGHAVGLNHFDTRWPPPSGPFQLMKSSVGEAPTFQSGDINGLGYLQNPAGSFVASTYCDFLARRVDAAGYHYWVGQLLIDQPGLSPVGYVDLLARSNEYIRALIRRFYVDTLRRQPDPGGLAYWTGELQQGRRSVADVAGQFYGSAEYVGRFSSLQAWVADLYTVRLSRPASADDMAFWSSRARTLGTATVAGEIYQQPESLRLRVATLYVALLRRSPDAGGVAYWSPRIAATGDLTLARDLASSPEYLAGAPTFVRTCAGRP